MLLKLSSQVEIHLNLDCQKKKSKKYKKLSFDSFLYHVGISTKCLDVFSDPLERLSLVQDTIVTSSSSVLRQKEAESTLDKNTRRSLYTM